MLQREGSVFRTNAEDFEYWWHDRGSDMCDDIIAFRIVGLKPLTELEAHALASEWQKRFNCFPLEATYGEAAALAKVQS